MKRVRVRGAYLWLMTAIETTDDLMDAFNSAADTVISPYHISRSDAVLKDIIDVSDSFIPAVYVSRGRGIRRDGRKTEVSVILDGLLDMNYYRICIVDTDMSMTQEQWDGIAYSCPSAVPFPGVRYAPAPAGFGDRVYHVTFRRFCGRIFPRPRAGRHPRRRLCPGIPCARPIPCRL